MILLVFAKGLNLSVMACLKLSDIRRLPGPRPGRWIYGVDIDKPRRGSGRYSSITFSGRAARLLQRTVAIGKPARDTLAELGFAEDPLFDFLYTEEQLLKTREPPVHHRLDGVRKGLPLPGMIVSKSSVQTASHFGSTSGACGCRCRSLGVRPWGTAWT